MQKSSNIIKHNKHYPLTVSEETQLPKFDAMMAKKASPSLAGRNSRTSQVGKAERDMDMF